jgi:hypothetical protein
VTLNIEQFNESPIISVFNATLKEYKNPNIHRAIVILKGHGDPFTEKNFLQLRNEIASSVKISKLKGFGFGLILNNFEVIESAANDWIDNKAKSDGSCQWIVSSNDNTKTGVASHMWQKGRSTPIFEATLAERMSDGFSIGLSVKPPEGLMKWAVRLNPLLAQQLYKP